MSQRPGHSSQSWSLLFPSWDQRDPLLHRNPMFVSSTSWWPSFLSLRFLPSLPTSGPSHSCCVGRKRLRPSIPDGGPWASCRWEPSQAPTPCQALLYDCGGLQGSGARLVLCSSSLPEQDPSWSWGSQPYASLSGKIISGYSDYKQNVHKQWTNLGIPECKKEKKKPKTLLLKIQPYYLISGRKSLAFSGYRCPLLSLWVWFYKALSPWAPKSGKLKSHVHGVILVYITCPLPGVHMSTSLTIPIQCECCVNNCCIIILFGGQQ